MKMKIISSILMIIVLSGCIGVNNGFINDYDEPTISKTYTLNEPGILNVKTSGGSISVFGHDENTVIVKVFVTKNGQLLQPDDEFITKLEEGYDLNITQNGKEISATAKRIKNLQPWRHISISFQIIVPYKMSGNLQTSGGSITIADMEGSQRLATSGGGVKIRNINGEVKGKTSGGSIKVEGNQGEIDISTSGGGISIVNSTGSIKAHTSGGGIRLENVNGNADVKTSGGSIKLSGEMDNVTARTSGGGIKVDITSVPEKLYLQTSGGSIHASILSDLGLDLDLKGSRVNIQLKDFDGFAKKNEIKGSMNGGGIPVYMHTSGGGVSITFQ